MGFCLGMAFIWSNTVVGCLDDRVKRGAAKGHSTLEALTGYVNSLKLTATLVPGSYPFKKELGSPQSGSTCGNCGFQLPHDKGTCPA